MLPSDNELKGLVIYLTKALGYPSTYEFELKVYETWIKPAYEIGKRQTTEIERTARLIAAHKMGLVKDVLGEHLPDDIWKQAIPAAERELALIENR